MHPFSIADTLNLQYNQFPSLHVAFACSAAWAYSSRSGLAGRLGWGLWSLAVAASTWLIREHHLFDIIGGIALAAVVMGLIYPWLERPSTRQAIWVELCCLWQCLQFSTRHVRYFVIFLAVKAINRLRRATEAAPAGPTAQEKLLAEIRDLLRKR